MNIVNAYNRPGIKKALCVKCKKRFMMDKKRGWCYTRAVIEEIQTSNFRGDDEVNFYHIECWEDREA